MRTAGAASTARVVRARAHARGTGTAVPMARARVRPAGLASTARCRRACTTAPATARVKRRVKRQASHPQAAPPRRARSLMRSVGVRAVGAASAASCAPAQARRAPMAGAYAVPRAVWNALATAVARPTVGVHAPCRGRAMHASASAVGRRAAGRTGSACLRARPVSMPACARPDGRATTALFVNAPTNAMELAGAIMALVLAFQAPSRATAVARRRRRRGTSRSLARCGASTGAPTCAQRAPYRAPTAACVRAWAAAWWRRWWMGMSDSSSARPLARSSACRCARAAEDPLCCH